IASICIREAQEAAASTAAAERGLDPYQVDLTRRGVGAARRDDVAEGLGRAAATTQDARGAGGAEALAIAQRLAHRNDTCRASTVRRPAFVVGLAEAAPTRLPAEQRLLRLTSRRLRRPSLVGLHPRSWRR